MEGLIVLALIVGALVKFVIWLTSNPADTKAEPRQKDDRFVSEGFVSYSPFLDDPDRVANRLTGELFERRRPR
ncbi:hypothetical protein [Azospirillum argentinense]|nr:hypothetical protein [Azospirillum argentinense]